MDLIKDKEFGGERPLFGAHDLRLENIVITDGESGIKCCQNLECDQSKFYGKYPWWHVDGSVITNCYFAPESRSAIWYSNDMVMKDSVIDGPKFFREMNNITLENVNITDADETFWRVDGIKATNLVLHEGTYPFMFSKNIYIDGLKSDSRYVFQYCQNVEIHNAQIVSRDCFWECDNVTIYDSNIDSEYLGWHSRNVKFVRCYLCGEQPLCYMNGVTLVDCSFDPMCDRVFEDSNDIDATISGKVTEIKNPISGQITADEIGGITFDEYAKGHECKITERT